MSRKLRPRVSGRRQFARDAAAPKFLEADNSECTVTEPPLDVNMPLSAIKTVAKSQVCQE